MLDVSKRCVNIKWDVFIRLLFLFNCPWLFFLKEFGFSRISRNLAIGMFIGMGYLDPIPQPQFNLILQKRTKTGQIIVSQVRRRFLVEDVFSTKFILTVHEYANKANFISFAIKQGDKRHPPGWTLTQCEPLSMLAKRAHSRLQTQD